MVFVSKIDGTEVYIHIDQTMRYGIMLSGGLDSAVLLAMIIKAGITDIQPFTIDKSDGSHSHANRVIRYFNTLFSIGIPETILVGDPRLHHSIQGRSAVIDILSNYDVDLLFNALNRNPPLLDGLPSAPKRTTREPNKILKLPFVDIYKTHILDFMYQVGQTELMNITHSCTEQSLGRCNICWQCKERQWAFNELNKLDEGTQ